MLSNLPKPVSFAILGAIGCFVAAVFVGEPLHLLLEPTPPPPPQKQQVDVVFVLDATASMQFAIDGTKAGIQTFVDELDDDNLDSRVGLVAFRDRLWQPPQLDVSFVLDVSGSMDSEILGVRDGIESFASSLEGSGLDVQIGLVAFCNSDGANAIETLSFKDGFFTKNYAEFKDKVSRLSAFGGGDNESSYLGLYTAVNQNYRKDSKKLLILISDEPPKIPDANVRSTAQMVDILKQLHDAKLYCVVNRELERFYQPLAAALPQTFFSLSENGRRVDFSQILPAVATQIATDLGDSSDRGGATRNVFSAEQLEPVVLDFSGSNFTSDPAKFRSQLASIEAVGGGDIPESSLDALALASGLDFRIAAGKVLVLITDAPPRIPDKDNADASETAMAMKAEGISQFHGVTMTEFEQHYRSIQTTAGIDGKFFSLAAAATGSDGFDAILPDVGEAIAVASVKGLQSGVAYSENQSTLLLTLVGLWTGFLSCGICLTLIAGQNASLRRQLMTLPEALKGGGGSLATGIISGIAGQLLFQYALGSTDTSEAIDAGNYSREIISRVCAWIMLGGMLGGTMAFFIPNLKWSSAALGGMIGGGIGAVGYLLTSSLGYSLGRILGAACLGLLIGLMVALSEIVSRSYWLEISYGENEKTRVNLGARPVTVGNDRSCTVWLSTGPPVKYSYAMEEGVIFCSDVATGHSISVKPNDANAINHITLTVRAAAVDSAQPMPLPPVAPPPPPPKKTKYASTAKTGDSPVPSSRPINSTRPPGTLPPPPPIKKDKQG